MNACEVSPFFYQVYCTLLNEKDRHMSTVYPVYSAKSTLCLYDTERRDAN